MSKAKKHALVAPFQPKTEFYGNPPFGIPEPDLTAAEVAMFGQQPDPSLLSWPRAVIVAPPVVGSLKNFAVEVAKIVETLPPNLPPTETTLADHFDCACGPKRNLSMEAGVYRCHGCGTTHHAQTLESRKAASK